MRATTYPLPQPAADGPKFLAIARAISDSIRAGRLRPGEALPGSRELAESLGVNRNTVLAALDELKLEGWIETSEARGTYVSQDLPDRAPRPSRGLSSRTRDATRPAFELRGAPVSDLGRKHYAAAPAGGVKVKFPLLGGVPDLRAAPHVELSRAFRRALARRPADALGYGDPRGDRHLRAALATVLAQTRGVVAGEDGVLVTRGSQMALYLAARTLFAPGDVVAVEAYGYRPAWEALRLAGAELVPVPVDHDGLRVDALEALAAKRPIRAVYTTPHHQYPTTATLPAGRRLALLALAKRARLAIVEDDYDHEFHYDGRPTLPLASADDGSHVVYVGTLSKVLAPGLRMGFLVAPPPLLARATELRTFIDRQGDLALERAVAELVEDGVLARHTRKMRRIYRERRDALAAALQQSLPGLRFEVPAGGLALWTRCERDIDVDAWAARAEAAGVLVHTARRFTFDGRALPYFRLGYAPLDPAQLREAVRLFTSAFGPSSSARRPTASRARSPRAAARGGPSCP